MRILFTWAAGLGHVFPLVPLARAAVATGDQVLFAVPREGIVTVEQLGFAATVIPDGDPRDIGKAWSELPDHDVNTYVVADIFVRVQALAALPMLQAAIRDHRADLVVTTEFGGIVAAESCGVPNALVGITALDLADLDMARVSDAVDDLREAAALRRTGQLPYATGSHYLSAVPRCSGRTRNICHPAGSGTGMRMRKVRARSPLPTLPIGGPRYMPRS